MKELKDDKSIEKVIYAAENQYIPDNEWLEFNGKVEVKELSKNQRFHVDMMLTYIEEIYGAFPTGPSQYRGEATNYSVNQNTRRHSD